ncbi:MAG: orotate phosphoribosyltransferase [Acidimicrobiia bacterium]
MRAAQAALAAALREHALREGDFTLASGRRSSWYVDGRQVTFRGDCVEIVGEAILDAVRAGGGADFDAVGGLAIGADPVSVAVAFVAGKRAFAVRKEAKGHGVAGRIAGPLRAGDRVLVVEDTVTSGASLLTAADVIGEFGCAVVGAACLLDRADELAPALHARGIPYFPALVATDLGFAIGS